MTWLAGGLALWYLLTKPSTTSLVVSMNQDEAAKILIRIWSMLYSLPPWLRDVEILKPTRGALPGKEISIRHKAGEISEIRSLPSTPSAGHGSTAALVVLDEFARQEYAEDTWKAAVPTMADGGRLIVISTANGVSNQITGGGNYYHRIWIGAEGAEFRNVRKRFLRWDLRPGRTIEWREALDMTQDQKEEQYPDEPDQAFLASGRLYFDRTALNWYTKEAKKKPLFRCDFQRTGPRTAKILRSEDGYVKIFAIPDKEHDYAIGADVATGRGLDYSAAYVVDLSSMELAAEFHGKLDADLFAYQLHYLGRYYNTARIAVEMGGGYGEPVIISLRDGKEGRPAYPKLYRYTESDRGDLPTRKVFGFPMTMKTRPLVISQLEKAIREHSLPWMTEALLEECRTFVHKQTHPSPAADEGTNDDLVMSAAITLELYREFGHHPHKIRKRAKKPIRLYPWQPELRRA